MGNNRFCKLQGVFLVALAAVFALASVSGPTAMAEPKGTVTFARPEEIQRIDPQDHFNLVNRGLERLIYDMLVELTPDGQIVPALAESWEVSEDGKVWTFHLRSGVSFHNGEPFNAQSVKFTLERLRDTRTLAQSFLWQLVESVDVVDDYTVQVRTARPYGALLANLTITPMLPPQAYAEQGDALWNHPIGTGPFRFVEWIKNQRYVVEANRNYWREGTPLVERIVYRPIFEEAALIAGLQTGELDIIDTVPPEQVPFLEMVPGVKVIRGLAWDQLYLGLKVDKEPFTDRRVRHAISHAIDREGLVEFIMGGGRPAAALVPQGIVGFHPGLAPREYDPERARALLAEAGYPNGFDLRLIAPQGWYPKMNELLAAIGGQLQDVGIRATLQIMEGGPFTEARGSGNYDIYITGGAHNGDPDFMMMQRVYDDVFKSGYRNETLNDLIRRAGENTDFAERDALYRAAQEIMYEEEAPMVWLFQMEHIYATNDRVEGFGFAPDKNFDLRWVRVVK